MRVVRGVFAVLCFGIGTGFALSAADMASDWVPRDFGHVCWNVFTKRIFAGAPEMKQDRDPWREQADAWRRLSYLMRAVLLGLLAAALLTKAADAQQAKPRWLQDAQKPAVAAMTWVLIVVAHSPMQKELHRVPGWTIEEACWEAAYAFSKQYYQSNKVNAYCEPVPQQLILPTPR